MNYGAFSTEKLRKELKQGRAWLQWSRNLVSIQGGWMMWDGDAEERMEEKVRSIEAELSKREKDKVWI